MSTTKSRTVLFPIDGSEHSERAFDFYLAKLKQPNDKIKFVNVIEPTYSTSGSSAFQPIMEAQLPIDLSGAVQRSIKEGNELCKRQISKAQSNQLKEVESSVLTDNKPGPAIAQAIADSPPDLVVVGNRGLGMVRRTILGGVSTYLLNHSKAPVVVVPPKDQ